MICDRITAYSYLQSRGAAPAVTFRPFQPAITSGVSILTPAHSPQSGVSAAFCQALSARVAQMQSDMRAELGR
jgi:hypothetical protein